MHIIQYSNNFLSAETSDRIILFSGGSEEFTFYLKLKIKKLKIAKDLNRIFFSYLVLFSFDFEIKINSSLTSANGSDSMFKNQLKTTMCVDLILSI